MKSLSVILIGVFLFTTLGYYGLVKGNDNSVRPPNIIIVMTDDQGWGDLSYNGNVNLSTPNIDALANNGVSFTNFFVQPVCSPTRAEFLTGKYATRLGIYDTSSGGERLNLGETTISEIFRKAGYKTAAYGKWHSGSQPPYHPNTRGFDDFYGFCSGHWGNYFGPMLEHNGKIVKGNGFLPNDLFEKGIDFISANTEAPFFLYLSVNTPHSPMQVPDLFWKKFENKKLIMKSSKLEKEDKNFTKAALAMVENIDWNVGKMIRKLKELDLEENTIVVYLSDNGPNGWRWNGGLKGKKGDTDEGGVKSPCFIQWPGTIKKGKQINYISGAIDLFPTLAGMAGIVDIPNLQIDGKDLSQIILQEKVILEPRAIFNHWNGKTSIRTQSYRLDHQNRLYDMASDLQQEKDISKIYPMLTDSLVKLKEDYISQVVNSSRKFDTRPFTVGYPKAEYTQLPARDGKAHGNIKRSNQYPNDSFFTNWISTKDSITWNIEVLSDGWYEVDFYYTMKREDKGAVVEISFKNSKLEGKINSPHDPPLKGMEKDRTPRIESYVKDFIPVDLGSIYLEKGKGVLSLKANKIPGNQVVDFRLMNLQRTSKQENRP